MRSNPDNDCLDGTPKMRFTYRGVLSVSIIISIFACSGGPTGYTKRDAWNPQYGYSDQQIDRDEFSIVVRGNSSTSKERVAQIALLRAAYLTREKGKTHFSIIKQKEEVLETEQMRSYPVVLGGIIVPINVQTVKNAEPTAILLIRILSIQSSDALSASEIIERLSKGLNS